MEAIRTVSETDDVHVIEARLAFGGPFAGRDSYGTYFSARTDWCLDLHPEGVPVLFNHGFDPDFGLSPIGRTSPTASFRTEADAVWVQMQLDKRHRYYATRVRPLIEAGGAGASQGSAEHSIRIDDRTGEVMLWPLQEISLTPTESNPWNVLAARTAETVRIIEGFHNEPDATPKTPVRAAAGDVACASGIQASLAALMDCEDDEPDQLAELRAAFEAVGRFIGMESAEIGTPEDEAEEAGPLAQMAYLSGIRAGRRNSESDQSRIDAIHDHATALGATAHAADAPPNDESNQEPDTGEADAARSAEALPTSIRIVERTDADALRADLLKVASEAGREHALKRIATG